MKVLVIGGGVIGAAVAFELARTGLAVTVLERSAPGAEASSAAAGMLAPQLEAQQPGPFLDLCLRSRTLYPDWARTLAEASGVSIEYRPSGALQVAFSDAELHALDATVAWQRACGLRAELLTSDETCALEPALSPAVLGAARYPDDHQCEPRRLMRALVIAATRTGVEFRTATAHAITEHGGRARGVALDDGTRLEADAVVLAAGAWSGLVAGAQLEVGRVKPARGQLVELQLAVPLHTHLLKSGGGYLVPRSDGRVVAGSTMELVGEDRRVTAGGLQKVLAGALQLVPALAQAPVTATWAGLRPWSDDGLPLLGPGPIPGVFFATGHFRNGILLAPITARVLGQLLRDEKPSVDVRPFRSPRFSP